MSTRFTYQGQALQAREASAVSCLRGECVGFAAITRQAPIGTHDPAGAHDPQQSNKWGGPGI
jgi:hypothetical protein